MKSAHRVKRSRSFRSPSSSDPRGEDVARQQKIEDLKTATRHTQEAERPSLAEKEDILGYVAATDDPLTRMSHAAALQEVTLAAEYFDEGLTRNSCEFARVRNSISDSPPMSRSR